MGPPGGGRSQITGRAVRHFNIISYTEFEEDSIIRIFSTIVTFFFKKFQEPVKAVLPSMIDSVLRIYNTVREELLPTPSKSHYTFNLRDISRVFQGICGIIQKDCQDPVVLVRLWYHENMRVFHDRLINEQDRTYFRDLLVTFFVKFGYPDSGVVLEQERILFCDFLGNRDQDVRPYQHISGDLT